MIYLDNSATTKIDRKVKKVMDESYEIYGNPSSLHNEGLRAKKQIDQARKTIADILHCEPKEIIFTSGGTESINLAIKGLAALHKKGHIITSKIEHPAVLKTCEYLETKGIKITYLDVDKYGLINLEQLEKSIKKNTFLITIMYANNEIGTIQNIKAISSIAKKHNLPFHTDACQAGTQNLNTKELGIDLMTLNASKIYGPKGVGLLYKKKKIKIIPLLHGGGQEFGLRSGTENLQGIIGFTKALELIQKDRIKSNEIITKLRDELIQGILKIPGTHLNGHPTQRLPINVNITIEKVEGEALLLSINERGICGSSGSACSAQDLKPSHVVLATGTKKEEANGTLRLTLGKHTKKRHVKKVLKELPKIVKNLREISAIKLKK